ncbi:HvfC/BufC N-terminal domain-containing protein [Undibacterium terreum]|uniref:DUF2063 domain-containing protein n=1 Tax=Undibacterium terreum TaxID=1224302 RepID=A0A916U921_9BURK|nr:DNA-binding domain-containing protein [Undibacterium terreum]GGC65049.1 DUF2063 domain-containing protein [Undibacterium terreum]
MSPANTTMAQLQANFQAWLVTGSEEAANSIGSRATAGLSVYQNNYRAQLVGCLGASYPQVRQWIGDEAFLSAAITHIDSHPPHAWTLDAYATGFDKTLAEMFPDNPDVDELAWIEYALAEAFIAADAAPLALDALGEVDWDNARLHITPSFMSIAATTNAERIWMALSQGKEAVESEMLVEPAGLIVWRRGYTSYLKQVDALEHEALLHLKENGSFAALCELLVERLGDTEGINTAGALLSGWLSNELISDIE